MSKQKGIMSVFLVAGLVVMVSPVGAQKPERSEKEVMYDRYLEFPSYPPKIVLHAVVAGFDVFEPTTDPNTFFTLFHTGTPPNVEFSFVGLHTPPVSESKDYDAIKKNRN